MKKVWEVIKNVLVWLGTILAAVFAVLFIRERKVDCFGLRPRNDEEKEDGDEINKRAAEKRNEAIARIERSDARTLAESYGSVCDTIADGKERFRRRCRRTDN